MSDKDKKLTPEQLQKIQQLQALMAAQQGQGGMPGAGGPAGAMPGQPQMPLIKRAFIGMLQKMSNSVKVIDQFINLITKEDGGNANDVIKSARSPIVFGIFVTIIFAVFGTLWAALAPLDSAAVAIGTVVTQSQKKAINHPEGGIIKQIFVKPGDVVKAGDQLIALDDTRIRAQYSSTLNQYRSYAAAEARLIAEINGDEKVTYPEFLMKDLEDKNVARIIETQNSLFQSRTEYFKAERDSIEQKIKQHKKSIEAREAKKISLVKNLEATQDRVEATRKLNQQGYAQKSVLLELESREATIVSEIAITETEIISYEQEITKSNIELMNVDNRMITDSSNELSRAQIELANVRESYFAIEDSLNRVIIRSPVDGVVNNLNYYTVGSSIPSSHTILEISPISDKLVIDAKIPPKNIEAIKVGLRSKIRFSAFKSRTSPLFYGEVVSLSPDIVIDTPAQAAGQMVSSPSNNPETAGGYYLARIEIDMEHFEQLAKPRKLSLVPGMQAEVQIITGTRTLLQYLLDPVYDAMFKGFKEK